MPKVFDNDRKRRVLTSPDGGSIELGLPGLFRKPRNLSLNKNISGPHQFELCFHHRLRGLSKEDDPVIVERD